MTKLRRGFGGRLECTIGGQTGPFDRSPLISFERRRGREERSFARARCSLLFFIATTTLSVTVLAYFASIVGVCGIITGYYDFGQISSPSVSLSFHARHPPFSFSPASLFWIGHAFGARRSEHNGLKHETYANLK